MFKYKHIRIYDNQSRINIYHIRETGRYRDTVSMIESPELI